MKLTLDIIFSNRTARGGFTRAQIEALGLPYPPKHGWPSRLNGKEITDEQFHRFVEAKNIRANRLRWMKKNPSKDKHEMDQIVQIAASRLKLAYKACQRHQCCIKSLLHLKEEIEKIIGDYCDPASGLYPLKNPVNYENDREGCR